MKSVQTTIKYLRGHLHLFVAVGVLALSGCATEPTRYSTGPIKARTFSFTRMVTEQASSFAEKRAEVHESIQQAIEKNLVDKGMTKVATNGDVTVLYLIIINDAASTQSINDFFGYGSSSILVDKAHQAFVIDKRNQSAYPTGTLVVDLVDMHQGKVLWRNFVYRPIMKNLPLEQRQVRLQEAVNEAFKGLRVAP